MFFFFGGGILYHKILLETGPFSCLFTVFDIQNLLHLTPLVAVTQNL